MLVQLQLFASFLLLQVFAFSEEGVPCVRLNMNEFEAGGPARFFLLLLLSSSSSPGLFSRGGRPTFRLNQCVQCDLGFRV